MREKQATLTSTTSAVSAHFRREVRVPSGYRTSKVHDLSRSAWLATATLKAGILTLTLKGGGVLVYSGIPAHILATLCRSKSPGAVYQRLVRGKYTCLASVSPARVPAPAPKPVVEQDLEALLRASLDRRAA